MNRRQFLATAGAAFLATACQQRPSAPLPSIPGQLLGADVALGHRLRFGGLPEATQQESCKTLIAGAGIAGLSAAWWLQRQGDPDFVLLEMEAQAGGNSRCGHNAVSAYPWGAHYLPLPGVEAEYVRLLLAELGVIKGDAHVLAPEYEERYLCAAPAERLFIHGHWQEGLSPRYGVPQSERQELARFDALVHFWRERKGQDGRRAFALPMALSSQDPEILALDQQSMHDWLLAQGLTSPSLHWLVNYSTRDDFGTDYRMTSAWAGLHYFCARTGRASNADHDTVLTWPEGNGWLAQRLAAKVASQTRPRCLLWRMGQEKGGAWADVYLAQEQRTVRYHARHLVWAGPTVMLPYLWPDAPAAISTAAKAVSHAPWLVANLTLSEPPAQQQGGAELAWDNVLYAGQGLGYVVATHQNLQVRPGPTVLTYYQALSEQAPVWARTHLLGGDHATLTQRIVAELTLAHPDLPDLVQNCDIWRWGHAMIRPTPGLITGARQQLAAAARQGPILLAHSDLSGFSLFEEAQYWGIQAADFILQS